MKMFRLALAGVLPVIVPFDLQAQEQAPKIVAATTANTLPAKSDQLGECIDSWAATPTANAPTSRSGHTALWTGSEMVVWGGDCCSLYTGGRYSPSTDSWTATTTTNAPTGRFVHTAVWAESEMIVWGGGNNDGMYLKTGGRYCAQSGPPITLGASVQQRGGQSLVVLTWGPADGGSVIVVRDRVILGATENDGETEDRLGPHTGVFTYQVCATDLGYCSNLARVKVQGTDD